MVIRVGLPVFVIVGLMVASILTDAVPQRLSLAVIGGAGVWLGLYTHRLFPSQDPAQTVAITLAAICLVLGLELRPPFPVYGASTVYLIMLYVSAAKRGGVLYNPNWLAYHETRIKVLLAPLVLMVLWYEPLMVAMIQSTNHTES